MTEKKDEIHTPRAARAPFMVPRISCTASTSGRGATVMRPGEVTFVGERDICTDEKMSLQGLENITSVSCDTESEVKERYEEKIRSVNEIQTMICCLESFAWYRYPAHVET